MIDDILYEVLLSISIVDAIRDGALLSERRPGTKIWMK